MPKPQNDEKVKVELYSCRWGGKLQRNEPLERTTYHTMPYPWSENAKTRARLRAPRTPNTMFMSSNSQSFFFCSETSVDYSTLLPFLVVDVFDISYK